MLIRGPPCARTGRASCIHRVENASRAARATPHRRPFISAVSAATVDAASVATPDAPFISDPSAEPLARPVSAPQTSPSSALVPAAAPPPAPPPPPTPELLTRLVKAHSVTVSALLVLNDTRDQKTVVSASLDKTLATWRLSMAQQSPAEGVPAERQVDVMRLSPPSGPVFSLVRQPNPPPDGVFGPTASLLYCGTAGKEVIAWDVRACPPDSLDCEAHFQVVAAEYTGWVRSLAMSGKYLFSCGCNYLKAHDTSLPLPKAASEVVIFKGDIQAIAVGVKVVYTASSDGAIRAFKLGKGGSLTQLAEVVNAHESRVTAIVVYGGHLYSTSQDGSVKAWNADTLACMAEVKAAHVGEKIHAAVMGPDGLLYTGGDDKLIRLWHPLSAEAGFLAALEPPSTPPPELTTLKPAGPPLASHASAVRVLAAGGVECLVSGDSDGDLCIWSLPSRKATTSSSSSK